MALTSQPQPFQIKDFQGMNLPVSVNNLDDTHSLVAQNCRFKPGEISSRVPITYYNGTSMGAFATTFGFRYYTSTGITKTLTFCNETMYVGADSTGTMTAIRTTLTAGKRFSAVTYKDLCYMSNGYDRIFIYDGASDNVTWDMGSCKALAGAAGNITKTSISYKVSFDADALITDAVSNEIAAVTTKKIELTNIPLGPVGTTNRKIWRKDSSTGGFWKLLTTLSNNTATTYQDDTADVSGNAAIGAATDLMPKGSLLQLFKERLYISGNPTYPNRIYFSNPYLPHFIQQTTQLDYMDITPDDNDEIMGIPIQLGVMCVVKKNTIRKVYIGGEQTSWSADAPISFVGSSAMCSIVQSPYGIIYQGWSGWYIFDGAVSKEIMLEFGTDSILSSRFGETVAFWDKENLLIAYTDAFGENNYHNRVARYNFTYKTLAYDKLDINWFFAYRGDDESGELYYCDSKAGFIYMAESNPLWLRYRTKSDLDVATFTDAHTDGTEGDPYFRIGRTGTIDALAGNINDLTGTIDMNDTDGTVVFPSVLLNAGKLDRLYWNLLKFNSADTVSFYIRAGATQTACESAGWGTAHTNPNGSVISTTTNAWIQIKVEMTANSTAGSPIVYFSDGFVVKMVYTKGVTVAESAVEFIYETGHRNFNMVESDKIYQKLILMFDGQGTGNLTVYWYTRPLVGAEQTGSFVIPLSTYPWMWESYFPSNAFGRTLNLKFYKNDVNTVAIREVRGLINPQPALM